MQGHHAQRRAEHGTGDHIEAQVAHSVQKPLNAPRDPIRLADQFLDTDVPPYAALRGPRQGLRAPTFVGNPLIATSRRIPVKQRRCVF
jgi:hypothetical protein